MKYLPISELEHATSALNFYTSDCRVVGGCDLYTTKAAGSDKKLYKSIEQSLESQHESLILLAKSLSPPNAEMFNVNLDRASPFGQLGKVSSRRTFAYMIATLNASHPDYDFSQFLRPTDFRREKHLATVVAAVDDTLYNLRPRPTSALLAKPNNLTYNGGAPPQTPGGSVQWSPRVWDSINKEMDLKHCEIYRYSPEEDPFDGDESAIWSVNYFFFNREKKRVLYIHFRGLNHSKLPSKRSPSLSTKRPWPVSRHLSFSKTGASKRARYWLGDKADRCVSEPVWGEDGDDEADFVIAERGDDDEMDADDGDAELAVDGSETFSESDDEDADEDELEMRWRLHTSKSRSPPRAVSESIAEQVEI